MSLSDTVFIFVLALIIFGPKKLPEIGRQIGRLVGEFRRASNEFKFQIEEELRQADTPKISNTIARPAIASSPQDADLSISSGDGTIHPASDFSLSEAIPAGQHPNPDAMQEVVDSSAIHEPERDWSSHEIFGEPKMPVSLATITAAVGAEARKTEPYVPVVEAASPTADAAILPAEYEPHPKNGSSIDAPSASPYPASPEAEIHHG